MLRRKATRIELKQDDIAEFEQLRKQQLSKEKQPSARYPKSASSRYNSPDLSSEQRMRGGSGMN